ncbi:hypothetical protein IMZ11_02725 [Microtetraspora sp. AC03309]|uniref:hypothetical protein n=1 Tax=Microtetraspora sp. AC03309 TaxID=2779376 RepID=UPI001E34AFCB|nr:hypothetical protein [Microtetraspora sp. AC03309]MCC5574554.1 hypothetical protein [Microtetraspora sp. AC03309]
MRNRNNDQLVAPATPAVKFATDEAAQTILSGLKTQYDNATTFAAQQVTLADKCQAEIDAWAKEIEARQQEIRDRQAWIEQRELEIRQAQQRTQQGRDVAKGAADTLALLGAPVPPPAGELSHNPDELISRIDAAHNEQDAAERGRS